jgi:hypothetical protein
MGHSQDIAVRGRSEQCLAFDTVLVPNIHDDAVIAADHRSAPHLSGKCIEPVAKSTEVRV